MKNNYFFRLLRRWLRSLWHLGKDVLALLFIGIVLGIQLKMGWVASGHGWQAVVVNLGPSFGVIVVFLLIHLASAISQLDKEREAEISRLKRALTEVTVEWPKRLESMKHLGFYLFEGETLKRNLESNQEVTRDERIREWHKHLPSQLYQYSESYKQRFCQDHNQESTDPPDSRNVQLWMHNHIYRLKQIMRELEGLPQQLISCTQYIETQDEMDGTLEP